MFMSDFFLILPEVILIAISLLLILKGIFFDNRELIRQNSWIAILTMGFVGSVLCYLVDHGQRFVAFGGQFILDDFVVYAKMGVLFFCSALLVLTTFGVERETIQKNEYPVFILFTVIGMFLMLSANDLIVLFIGLEIQALPLYILVGLNRSSKTGVEAALKYFILGSIASCFYLYGVSFIYGFSGATNFDILQSVFQADRLTFSGVFVGLFFILSSMAFKISLVPYHMWAPDVYEGSSYGVTAYIASVPKFAVLMVLLRLLYQPFEFLSIIWQDILFYGVSLSLLWGAFAALRQNNIKRLLAYSSIHHLGFAALGLISGTEEGIEASILYITIYLIIVLGVFGSLLCLTDRSGKSLQTLDDCIGLGSTHPFIAVALAIFLFSMAGIPPFAGLFAKICVLKSVFGTPFYSIAIIGIVAAIVAACYYLRFIKKIFFDMPVQGEVSLSFEYVTHKNEILFIISGCLFITIFFIVWPRALLNLIQPAVFALIR